MDKLQDFSPKSLLLQWLRNLEAKERKECLYVCLFQREKEGRRMLPAEGGKGKRNKIKYV